MFAKFDENGKLLSFARISRIEDVRPDPEGFEEIPDFPAEDLPYLCKENGTVKVSETMKLQTANEKTKFEEYLRNKAALVRITEDIVQFAAGEDVPQIEERKAEFIRLHNKVRLYEGKAARSIRAE